MIGLPVTALKRSATDFLRRHAARHRELEVREVALAELLVVEERVVERVDRGHAGEFLVTDDHHHALHVARIGDQDVAPAEPMKISAFTVSE